MAVPRATRDGERYLGAGPGPTNCIWNIPLIYGMKYGLLYSCIPSVMHIQVSDFSSLLGCKAGVGPSISDPTNGNRTTDTDFSW